MTYGIGNSPFGWDLPPGVTQKMIDDHFGGDDEPEDFGEWGTDEDPREDPHYDY